MTKDDMMPRKPQFTPNISFGNVVQIFVLGAGFIGGYVLLQEQAEDNTIAFQSAEQEGSSLELRIRTLETQQARADLETAQERIIELEDKYDPKAKKTSR